MVVIMFTDFNIAYVHYHLHKCHGYDHGHDHVYHCSNHDCHGHLQHHVYLHVLTKRHGHGFGFCQNHS